MNYMTIGSAFTAGLAILTITGTAGAQQVKPKCTDDSRKCMIAAASTYLDGLITHDGSKVWFAPDIRRTVNAHPLQGEDNLRKNMATEPPMLGRKNTRFFVDEKNHVIVAFALLRLDNDKNSKDPRISSQAGPVTVHLAERMKIEHGLIEEIEGIFHNEAGTNEGTSGWPDK